MGVYEKCEVLYKTWEVGLDIVCAHAELSRNKLEPGYCTKTEVKYTHSCVNWRGPVHLEEGLIG
jgi:hypothetical protein